MKRIFNWREFNNSWIRFFDGVYGLKTFCIVFGLLMLVSALNIGFMADGFLTYSKSNAQFSQAIVTSSGILFGYTGFLIDYKKSSKQERY